MDERYSKLENPPQNALRPIQAGNLKGKSDINPQWRIEALTECFGLCGIGWKFEVVNTTLQTCSDGQILVFMAINLYVKDNEGWSAPIPGFGGDMVVVKNKHGLVPNDEAYKMCLTDALGNAAKNIGVAASIYRGFYDSKYSRDEEPNGNSNATQGNNNATQNKLWRKEGSMVEIMVKDKWVQLIALTVAQLEWVCRNPNLAPIHEDAKRLLTTGKLA